ncbi:MAG: hypothetical protein LBF49_03470 [Puniceicoccales bacterium]|jgi:chromosome segregation ATPase|nr:hypothetical protein [Puniceicoccales bacterium]
MTEITQYTITVGSNTNVTATTRDLTAEQKKALYELQKMVPGDISISADGVVSITSQKGLALFNDFCQQNGIQDASTNKLMEINAPAGTTLSLEGLLSASAFCARFGRGKTDTSKMSFTELTTFALMMTYASEEERRRGLSEAKSAQTEIARKIAVDTWRTSREAAEKTYSAERWQAWGTIASGAASLAMAVGSGIFSLKASPRQGQLADNNKRLENNKLLQEQKTLKTDLELPDTKPETVKAKQERVRQQIQQKQEQINDNQAKIKVNDESIEANNKIIETKQVQIEAKQVQIETAQKAENPAQSSRFIYEKTKLESENTKLNEEITALETQNGRLTASAVEAETEITKLESELATLKVQDEKLTRLSEIGQEIKKKGIDPNKDSLSEDEVKELKWANKKLEAEIAKFTGWSNTISSLSQSSSSVVKGSLDLHAAGSKKEASFLEIESRLSDTFRGVVQSQIQGTDSSINAANQNMQKIINALKQALDDAYSIKTSIARNI